MMQCLGLVRIDAQNLSPTDLSEECALANDRGEPFEAYRVQLNKEGNTCYLLWLPTLGRAGIAWGGDAEWFDANNPSSAVDQWLSEIRNNEPDDIDTDDIGVDFCESEPARPYANRTIMVFYDDASDSNNPGWVTRCTEFDDRDQPILGRTAMDEQLDAETLDDAIMEASVVWGCDPSEVAQYEGEL